MKQGTRCLAVPLGCGALALMAQAGWAQPATSESSRMLSLQQQVEEQNRQLEALKRSLAAQESALRELRRSLASEVLATQRGGAAASPVAAQGPGTPAAPVNQTPVGQAPDEAARRPDVAPIFEQPGVLTPRGKYVLEPSLQYAYSSSNRVALVGYTIIPALLIGVIDIREVRRSTFTGALTARYGVNNRFELESKLPYVYRTDSGVGREPGTGASVNTGIYDTSGRGLGDIEFTARYQLNDGGLDRPYYVGSLRFKTRTGKDPFEVVTSKTLTGFRSDGVQLEQPTGSGFYGLQPALTVLYPSDPAVFFGTVSYLHSFARSNVVRRTDIGDEALGRVAPGGIFGFNFGMGLGLNEKSSFSIGYDHASVGKTKLNGQAVPESLRIQLGTLLLGYSHRLSPQRTLNVSLGAGLTRDTPDITLTVRVPMTF